MIIYLFKVLTLTFEHYQKVTTQNGIATSVTNNVKNDNIIHPR